MRERAIELVQSRPPATDGRHLLREHLQSRVLGALQKSRAMAPLAATGATALRFVYRQPRFCEELHFALERADSGFILDELTERVKRQLGQQGYELDVRVDEDDVVARASLDFSGILAAAGLSGDADESFEVSLAVDTQPSEGATLDVTKVNLFGPLRLHHHDLSSLFAAKVAEVVARPRTTGRDLYDLMWYLSWRPVIEPSRTLLESAHRRMTPEEIADGWRSALGERLEAVDWAAAHRDVAPLLERVRDLELIDASTFEHVLAESAL